MKIPTKGLFCCCLGTCMIKNTQKLISHYRNFECCSLIQQLQYFQLQYFQWFLLLGSLLQSWRHFALINVIFARVHVFLWWVKWSSWQITICNLLNEVLQIAKRNTNCFLLQAVSSPTHPSVPHQSLYASNPSLLQLFYPSRPRLNRLHESILFCLSVMTGSSDAERIFVILSLAVVELQFWHGERPLIYPPSPTAVRKHLHDDLWIFMRVL